MTHADSSLALLGRSRDTGSLGAAPPFPAIRQLPIQRVILRVWGLTPADVRTARDAADSSPCRGLWDVVDVVATHGGVCPIRPHDVLAVGQDADYGQAWAAYPADR